MGWLAYYQWLAPQAGAVAQAEQSVVPPELAPLPPAPQFRMPPFSQFRAITQRPLFAQTRRPLETGTVAALPDAPTPQPDVKLSLRGVVLDDDGRRAFILPEGSTELQTLEEGDEIGGWTLEKVEEESVIIRRGAETKELQLDFEERVQQPNARKSRREKRRQRLLEQQQKQQEEQDEEEKRAIEEAEQQ